MWHKGFKNVILQPVLEMVGSCAVKMAIFFHGNHVSCFRPYLDY